ncbi:MAG: competence/damage-inducible protein A [Acutalibacteraceae bacterium]
MKCELISVGTEILLGDILNTNAQYLSRRLADNGISVMFQHTVGDNEKRLLDTLDLAFEKSDMVITTGGLGPTPDDLTKEVCAEYFGIPLVEDKESLSKIEDYFKSKKLSMPSSNSKQALMPKDSIILQNKNGTAPGCIMEKDGKIIIVLPGPPGEMKPMFEDGVVPYLQKYTDGIIKSHNIRTFGIGESAMAQKVGDLLDMSNPTVAPYAKSAEALLRVTAKAENEKQAEELLKPIIDEIQERLNGYVYGIDKDSIEQATVELLKKKGLTAATAESCTAGLISKRLTDIPGSSAVFTCGITAYANEIKEKVLGVKKEHLRQYGAVSEVVAAEMAVGAVRLSGADAAVSVTGIAGPESDGTDKPVGLVYIGLSDGKKVKVIELHLRQEGDSCREYNRTASASNAINLLRLFALSYPEMPEGSFDAEEYISNF